LKIEILVFDGCPNIESTEKLVRDSVDELGIDANIEIVNVVDNDDAIAKRFLGSPSIRINGKDLEIEESEFTQYSMRCRVYRSGRKTSGIPDKNVLLDCLRNASRS
jgi:Thioredoxin domain